MGVIAKHNKEQEIVTNEVFHQFGQQSTSLQMLKFEAKNPTNPKSLLKSVKTMYRNVQDQKHRSGQCGNLQKISQLLTKFNLYVPRISASESIR